MKNLKVFLVVLFTALCSFVFAQTVGEYQDVVYLKNGNVYRGVIVEQIPGKSLKIQTSESTYNIQLNEVEKFTREPIHGGKASMASSEKVEKPRKEISYLNKGYFFQGQLGFNKSPYVHIINGYKLGRFGMLGIGTGIGSIEYGYGGGNEGPVFGPGIGGSMYNAAAVPIFLYYEMQPTRTKVSPVFNFKIGYSISVDRSINPDEQYYYDIYPYYYNGGVQTYGATMTEIGLGLVIRTKRNFDVGIALTHSSHWSYVNHYANYSNNWEQPDYLKSYSETEYHGSPGIRLTFGFGKNCSKKK